jgi:plasmid stabilization system protein ParE
MRIEWLDSAILDLQRLRDFILPHNKEAAQRAFKVIRAAVAPLETTPHIGKPVEDLPDYYDLIIPFGVSGYMLRYRIQGDTVYVVAVKHGREAGFSGQVPSAWLVNEPVEEAYGMLADCGPSLAEELLEERRKDNEREIKKEAEIFREMGAGMER